MVLRNARPAARVPHRLSVITAAAQRVNLAKLAEPRTTPDATGGWQAEAWDYFDSVPEVGFACAFTGNAMSKLRLYAACYPPGDDPEAKPIPVLSPDSGIPAAVAIRAQQLVDRIRSNSGGQAEILREWNINWEVAGDCYLVHWAARPLPGDNPQQVDPEPEEWEIRSRDEIVIKAGTRSDGTPGGVMYARDTPNARLEDMRRLVDGSDEAIRMWQRHPRWTGQAFSHMRACIGELRILQVLSGQLLAESMSRHNAGILAIPNELEVDRTPVNDPDSDPESDTPDFGTALALGLTAPISDPSSAASVVPVVVRGPQDTIAAIRHIALSRESTDTDTKITARLTRFAHGINLPPEVVEGHMQTTFANAEQIDDDIFDDYLEPRAVLMVQGLTFAVVQPDLLAEFGPTSADVIGRVFVWFDASDLVAQPDPSANADAAWDRAAISDPAYRRALGFTEEDAPTPEEAAARLAVLHAPRTPPGAPTTPGQAAVSPSPAPTPAPGVVAAGTNGHRRSRPSDTGARLVAIDQHLRERLLVLSDRALRRALERAGNQASNRMGRSNKAALSRVPAERRLANAGPAMIADAGIDVETLLDDAFEGMRPQFMAWGASAQRQALEAASRAVSGLSLAERDVLGARQASSLGEAWSWFEHTLTVLTKARLFDPTAFAPTLGEVDASLTVPAGVVRSAMALAGGATGLHVDEGRGVWLPLTNADTTPAGGIGTGELIMGTLTSGGATVEGYRWVYGPAQRTRPFDPHVELDGVEFANFDDDVLANTDSFPEFGFYIPGDHPGCICDYEPLILAAP